jgi:hypothetical protein
MILPWERGGKVGRHRVFFYTKIKVVFSQKSTRFKSLKKIHRKNGEFSNSKSPIIK